jgi:hypothetical protein
MTRKKTAGRGPAKKTPAKGPAQAKTPAKAPAEIPVKLSTLVEPLAPQALQLVLGIIDNADIKGKDAQLVIGLKVELGRVAGVPRGQQ